MSSNPFDGVCKPTLINVLGVLVGRLELSTQVAFDDVPADAGRLEEWARQTLSQYWRSSKYLETLTVPNIYSLHISEELGDMPSDEKWVGSVLPRLQRAAEHLRILLLLARTAVPGARRPRVPWFNWAESDAQKLPIPGHPKETLVFCDGDSTTMLEFYTGVVDIQINKWDETSILISTSGCYDVILPLPALRGYSMMVIGLFPGSMELTCKYLYEATCLDYLTYRSQRTFTLSQTIPILTL